MCMSIYKDFISNFISGVRHIISQKGDEQPSITVKSIFDCSAQGLRIPVIKVKDLHSGEIHIVGADIHDSLILRDNKLCYYNKQNGSGTGFDVFDEYEFISETPDELLMYTEKQIEFLPAAEYIALLLAEKDRQIIELQIQINDLLLKQREAADFGEAERLNR